MMNSRPVEPLEVSDEELLGFIDEGDEAALDILMRRHQGALYRFVLHNTADAALSADIVQETFVRVWLHSGDFRPDRGASGKTWLYSIALNLLRDEIRRRSRRGRWAAWFSSDEKEADAALERLPDPVDDPGVAAEKGDELDRLTLAVTKLPEKLRLPLVLCVLQGLPQEEAARILGTSRKAVESRVRRARGELGALMG